MHAFGLGGSALRSSGFANQRSGYTGLHNSAFTGARLGSNTLTFGRGFSHSPSLRSEWSHGNFGGWGGRGWRGRGWGGWGWGLGFGWGWGPGWGWGGFWGPYAYDLYWYSPYWYDPWWNWPPDAYYAPPAPGYNVTYPTEYTSSYNSNDSSSSYPSDSESASAPLPSTNSNRLTGNVAATTPTVLLYMKDGRMYPASDYWLADGQLHYTVNYGGESTVDMAQVDLQRTVDENAKRAVRFTLKSSPNAPPPAPETNDTPATSATPDSLSPSAPVTNQDNQAPVTSPATSAPNDQSSS